MESRHRAKADVCFSKQRAQSEDRNGDSMHSREKRLVSKLGESQFIHAVNGASYEPKFALVRGAKWRSKERKQRRE